MLCNNNESTDDEDSEDDESADPDIIKLKLNGKVSGVIDAGSFAAIRIKSGSDKTVILELEASSEKVTATINNKTVEFERVESISGYAAIYTLKAEGGREYIITLTASAPVDFVLTAKANEEENKKSEEETGKDSKKDPNSADDRDGDKANDPGKEENENRKIKDDVDDNQLEEEQVPPMRGWITVSTTEYRIGDIIVLNAESDVNLDNQVVWQNKVGDGDWKKTGYGNILFVELTEENARSSFRFKMVDGNFSDVIRLNAAEGQQQETSNTEESESCDEAAEEPKEETEEKEDEIKSEETENQGEAEQSDNEEDPGEDEDGEEPGQDGAEEEPGEDKEEEPGENVDEEEPGEEGEEESVEDGDEEESVEDVNEEELSEEGEEDGEDVDDEEPETAIVENYPEVHVEWKSNDHKFKSKVMLYTDLSKFEGEEYSLQWQVCRDGKNWVDIENATGDTHEFMLTMENYTYSWRVAVKVAEPVDEEA